MKNSFLRQFISIFIGSSFATGSALGQLSVHDIQYTADPSGNSPYVNQTVQVQGVITAAGYNFPPYSYSFFIADSAGGPWSGLLVASFSTLSGNVGDWVEVSGQVKETGGQTSLQFPSLTVIGAATVPDPAAVNTAQFNQEAHEGVLVGLSDVIVAAEESNDLWQIEDASGTALVGHSWPYIYQPNLGDTLYQVVGQGVFIGGAFRVEPRSDADIVFSGNPRPVITNIARFPVQPTASDSVVVQAQVADDDPLQRVELHYSFDGGAAWDSLEMILQDSLCTGWIAMMPQGTSVQYFILAEDIEGAVTQEPDPPATYTVAAPRMAVPLDSLVSNFAQFIDQVVTVEGLVTYLMEWTTSSGSQRITAYLQDASGRGIELSESGAAVSFPALERGHYVSLRGTISEFESAVQISDFAAGDIAVIYPDWPLSYVEPDSLLRTGEADNISSLDTDVPGVTAAGTWCRTKGYLLSVESAGGGRNLTLNDGSGPLVVRIWDDMYVPGAVVSGDTVEFEALIGQVIEVAGAASYYSGFQIEVGYTEDIKSEEPYETASSEAVLWVEPRVLVPDMGETITIRYNAPAGAWIRLRLLNLKGQLVAMIRDGQSGGGYEIEWDGLDELHRRVPVGVYILQLQSTLNGTTTSASAPLVVGLVMTKEVPTN